MRARFTRGAVFLQERTVMDKITMIETEQALSSEQTADQSTDTSDQITPLAPECFGLIGGGSGILVL
jgi:hypothetical protein